MSWHLWTWCQILHLAKYSGKFFASYGERCFGAVNAVHQTRDVTSCKLGSDVILYRIAMNIAEWHWFNIPITVSTQFWSFAPPFGILPFSTDDVSCSNIFAGVTLILDCSRLLFLQQQNFIYYRKLEYLIISNIICEQSLISYIYL